LRAKKLLTRTYKSHLAILLPISKIEMKIASKIDVPAR